MPEENGAGRLDRIEANLEVVTERLDRLAAAQERDREEFRTFGRESNERMSRVEMSLENTARSLDRLFEMRTPTPRKWPPAKRV